MPRLAACSKGPSHLRPHSLPPFNTAEKAMNRRLVVALIGGTALVAKDGKTGKTWSIRERGASPTTTTIRAREIALDRRRERTSPTATPAKLP
jgi:hypothetical protein